MEPSKTSEDIGLYGVRLVDHEWLTTLDGSMRWIGDRQEMETAALIYGGTLELISAAGIY